jgi:hypothetical protein
MGIEWNSYVSNMQVAALVHITILTPQPMGNSKLTNKPLVRIEATRKKFAKVFNMKDRLCG